MHSAWSGVQVLGTLEHNHELAYFFCGLLIVTVEKWIMIEILYSALSMVMFFLGFHIVKTSNMFIYICSSYKFDSLVLSCSFYCLVITTKMQNLYRFRYVKHCACLFFICLSVRLFVFIQKIIYRGYVFDLQVLIEIYFTEWTPHAIFGKATSEIIWIQNWFVRTGVQEYA
jgi:hypothetical protein